MSSSSSVILPSLYSIQKLLENQQIKYGGTLLDSVDSSTSTKQPSKNIADDFFSQLMKSLIQFNGSCMSVYETYKSKRYAARSYLTLVIMLILAAIGFFIFYYYNLFKKIKIQVHDCLSEASPGIINESLNIGIVILLIIYVFFISVSVFKKNMKIYQTVYNVPNNPHFSGDLFIESQIHQITDLFVLEKLPNFNETPSFTSTCPAIPYLACKLKGWNTCTGSITNASIGNIVDNMKTIAIKAAASNVGGCQFNPSLVLPSTKCMSCLQNSCGQALTGSSVPDLEAALYKNSRVPSGSIDPYMLYRKLQRYDIAFQVARITDAVSYFNNFLLKENDMIAASSSIEDTMTNGIINLLSVNYCRITNLNITDSCKGLGTTLSTFTSDECHAHCISSSNYVASVFNTKSYQSTVYTSAEFQNMVFVNAPNDTSLDVVVKYGTFANIACILNNSNSNNSNLSTYSTSANQICDLSYDQFKIGCLNSNAAFQCSPMPQTQSYSNLFNNQNILSAPYPTYINLMTIDFGTDASIKTAVPATFASLKNVYVQSTVNFIQQTDPTLSFTLTDKVIANITAKLTSFYNVLFSTIAVSLSDILDQTNVKINQLKYAGIDPSNPLTKYITYNRFLSKFAALDQESFLNEFLYNVDEIRHTSSGLNNLYNIYDYSIYSFNSKKGILDFTYVLVIIVGIIVLVKYGLKTFYDYIDLSNENYIEDLKETLDKQTFDSISNDKIKQEIDDDFPEEDEKDKDKKEACYDLKLTKLKRKRYTAFEKQHSRKVSKEAKSKNTEIIIDGAFKFMFLLMFIIVLVALFYSWKEKSNVVFNFNMSMLTSNGETIVNNANSIFSSLINDNIMNNKLITYSALSSTAFDNLDEDGHYHEIQQKAQIQTSTPIIISASDDYSYIYDDITGLLEAYNQCNMLLFNLQGNLPFPLLEVSIYAFMIIIIMILSMIIVMKMKPKDKFERLQMLIKLKSKLESNKDIADEDLYFCQDEDNYDKQAIINSVKGVALILLPIFTVFFAVSLMQNTDDFTSGLYASTLFRDTQCYTI